MASGILVALFLLIAVSTNAEETARAPNSRGWIFGGGLSGGRMGFAGAEGKAVAVGEVTTFMVLPGGAVVPQRRIQVIDASAVPPPGTVLVAPFPTGVGAGGVTLHGGFAFSPRIALLADAELLATFGNGFQHGVLAAVVRYWPTRRIWVEGGPATGDVGYGMGNAGTESNRITGPGVLAAAGVAVIKKPRWAVDLQARYGRIWYDGFQGHNLSFGVSAGRVPSGGSAG